MKNFIETVFVLFEKNVWGAIIEKPVTLTLFGISYRRINIWGLTSNLVRSRRVHNKYCDRLKFYVSSKEQNLMVKNVLLSLFAFGCITNYFLGGIMG